MKYSFLVFVVTILLTYLAHIPPVDAQLPTFGPSCEAEALPTSSPTPTPTSPPGQPTYTPAPTTTPLPTQVPCSPTPVPPTPTRVPLPPRSGTGETTVLFLGLAGFLLLSGSLGLATFKKGL